MAREVRDALLRLGAVLSAEGVTGPFDIVASVETPDLEGLQREVIAGIHEIHGILRALPCLVTTTTIDRGGS